MSFNTALSGLNAASNNLSVTGNNIANAGTAGFKKSRSEFSDVYAASLGGVSNTTPGSGVRVANVAQQFNQGNLEFTDSNLDLAVSGEGFFVLGDSVENIDSKVFTRSGAFHVNREGIVVNNTGRPLLSYTPNGERVEDGFSQGVLTTVRLDTAQGLPQATENIKLRVNLDSRLDPPTLAFDTANPGADPLTYNKSTAVTVYDSLGNSHIATSYFRATPQAGQPNLWEVYTAVDGRLLETTPTQIDFDNNGRLIAPVGNKVTYPPYSLSNIGAEDLNLTYDFSDSTQLGSAFSVDNLTQDGLTIGRLTGVDIDDTGVIFARFSNGASKPLGQVALARFANPQGLAKLGDTLWGENGTSGTPITGIAGVGNFGSIKAGALEGSNVDLAAALVNLIVAQQTYQANAQTIQTENQITQAILQIQ